MSKVYVLKGDRVKKAQFVCGFESSVEYFDENGQPIVFEDVTPEQLEEKRAENARQVAEFARVQNEVDNLLLTYSPK
jgi:hypothetical protein